MAVCKSFICEYQPRITFGHHDIPGRPTWLHAYLPSTVLMMASFQCADSKPVCPLLMAILVSTVMAANKEMNLVVDGMAGEEPC